MYIKKDFLNKYANFGSKLMATRRGGITFISVF